MQVRFWRYLNGGMVRIKLDSEQVLHWAKFQRMDEGYHRTEEEYHHDNDFLYCRYQHERRDCDGRLTSGGLSRVNIRHYCEGDAIHRREENDRGPNDITYPAWEDIERDPIYDEYAQAAGY